MSKRATIALPILFILCFSLAGLACAQTRVPGVKAGDYFTYSITTSWISEDPNAVIPISLRELNNTAFYKFEVIAVLGPNVTAIDTWHLLNGTELQYVIRQDVESGTPYEMNTFQSVVGSNLNANDLLHPLGTDGLIINYSIARIYGIGPRETNVVNLDIDYYNSTSSNHQIENVTFHFDKTTGMLVESNDTISSTNPAEFSSVIWKLTESNVWSVSGPTDIMPTGIPLYITIGIIIAVAVILVAVITVFLRKHTLKGK